MWQWINFYLILSPNKCTDRQTNFKLSHGNTVNNSIFIKMRPFQQQQQIYGNWSTRVKQQRFKKDFDAVL